MQIQHSRIEFEAGLTNAREYILRTALATLTPRAIEAHIFGSMGRGNPDPYSDIDVWFTFPDEMIAEALATRLDRYADIGTIIHICEPPQNSPENGVHSFVLYETSAGLLQVDFYLCPLSTAFVTKDSKKEFGDISLPMRELSLNPQKIALPESYRIDFFLIFVFIAIKKLVRNRPDALDQLFHEYNNLRERDGMSIEPLTHTENNFASLQHVITNIKKIANEKQLLVLHKITDFKNHAESLLQTSTT